MGSPDPRAAVLPTLSSSSSGAASTVTILGDDLPVGVGADDTAARPAKTALAALTFVRDASWA